MRTGIVDDGAQPAASLLEHCDDAGFVEIIGEEVVVWFWTQLFLISLIVVSI